MKILFNPALKSRNNYGTISFQMKKSEFKGIDRKVVDDTKAPIEKFKTIDNFYNYCSGLIEKIITKNYEGRNPAPRWERERLIQEWSEYVLKENDAYTPPIAFMILSSITKDLKPNDDTLPPVLDKGVLAQTVEQVQNETMKNKKINFEKEYSANLKKALLAGLNQNIDESLNGWIVIPSKKQDPEHFNENVNKLKILSHNKWCTKGYSAEPYLTDGEFHIYMNKGRPELGIRFIGDKIQEIQGEHNSSRLPLKYLNLLKNYIKNYKLSPYAEREINDLECRKEYINDFMKTYFPKGVEQYSTQEILEAFGIKCRKDTDGLLIVSHYSSNCPYFTFEDIGNDRILYERKFPYFGFEDLGINEKNLFKDIKVIEGDASFQSSGLTNLGNLRSIGGNADFMFSQITDFRNLESIGGNATFDNSRITDLANLKTIGGDAGFREANVVNLGKLESIGGNVDFYDSEFTSLGNLQSIGGEVRFENSKITDLGNLKTIGGDADFSYSEVKDLGKLEYIGGDARFVESKIPNLGNLKTIKGYVDFAYSLIPDLGKLEYLGGAHFGYSQIKDLGNLESIDGIGNVSFSNSQITNLGKLKTINGSVNFSDSLITDLGNLEYIGKWARFNNSKITSLGNLQTIGGDANFRDSQVTDLSKLQSINGSAFFDKSQITNLGNLKFIGEDADFTDSQITDLCDLQSVGKDAIFNNSRLLSLGNLKSIGRDAYFDDSQVTDLGHLESIDGDVCIENSKLKPSDFSSVNIKGRFFSGWKQNGKIYI